MLANDITLIGDSASTRTYALRSILDGSSVRANPAAPPALPETMTIKNTSLQKQGEWYDRRLVRLDLGKETSEGVSVNGSMQVVFEIPRDAVFTVAMVRDIRTQMLNLLVNANLDKILNGEP